MFCAQNCVLGCHPGGGDLQSPVLQVREPGLLSHTKDLDPGVHHCPGGGGGSGGRGVEEEL